ncbi:MAG: relaxase, partial [Planctomycetota bacterium]
RFGVYRPEPLAVAPGDKLRITAGGSTIDGKHRLNNGTIYRLRGFDGAGNLQLTNGWTIARDFGHVAHGYVVTSHASQGKTVDTVLVAASTRSLRATSAEQAYVSASRGKKRAMIYTDDKQSLLDAVARSEDRTTATDLLRRQAQAERSHERVVQRELEKVRG